MANTRLLKTDETVMITLDGDGYSFIAETSVRKEAIITPLPLGSQDSANTLVFDYGGVIQTFTIRGVHIATSAASVKSFIMSMNALIQGNQTISEGYPFTYEDDYQKDVDGNSLKVKIMDVECIKEAGEPFVVRWTVKLVQASPYA